MCKREVVVLFMHFKMLISSSVNKHDDRLQTHANCWHPLAAA